MIIPNEIMGMCLVEYDNNVFLLCDDIKKGKLDFNDHEIQSCIQIHFMRGSVELLRICARELTNSQKDYHIVNQFIDELEKIHGLQSSTGSIEVVE